MIIMVNKSVMFWNTRYTQDTMIMSCSIHPRYIYDDKEYATFIQDIFTTIRSLQHGIKQNISTQRD